MAWDEAVNSICTSHERMANKYYIIFIFKKYIIGARFNEAKEHFGQSRKPEKKSQIKLNIVNVKKKTWCCKIEVKLHRQSMRMHFFN